MLSPALVNSFLQLADSTTKEAVSKFFSEAQTVSSDAAKSGAYHSSGHIFQLERAATRELVSAAEVLLKELLEVHRAAPTQDLAGRATQLSELLSVALEQLGAALMQARDLTVSKVQGARGIQLKELGAMVASQKAKLGAKLYIGAVAITNKVRPMTTTLNIHGQVGAVQTGDGAVANVNQTIHPPSREEVVQALSVIEAALRAQLGANAKDQLEVVEDLRGQVQREEPNSLKVSASLGALATLVQTLPNVGPAWETVVRWGTTLASLGGG